MIYHNDIWINNKNGRRYQIDKVVKDCTNKHWITKIINWYKKQLTIKVKEEKYIVIYWWYDCNQGELEWYGRELEEFKKKFTFCTSNFLSLSELCEQFHQE